MRDGAGEVCKRRAMVENGLADPLQAGASQSRGSAGSALDGLESSADPAVGAVSAA